ncbi:hypothetical protein HNV12_18080 [Methanococcoides sp. SA1]|nr:hypothetical protein [Methanococcoides sp. SA1]
MKLNKIILFSIVIMMSTCFVAAAEQLSEYEASKIGSSYAYEGEICEAYGPYEYNNNYYYICSIFEGDALTAEIVIDASTGNVVTSESVSKYIIKHDLALSYLFDEESYYLNIDSTDIYRQNVNIFKDYYDFWIEIRDSANTVEQKQNAQEAADISQDIMIKYEDKVEVNEKIIEIQNKIKSGGTLEDAKDIIEAEEAAYYTEKQYLAEIGNAIERTPVIYDKILTSNYRYGIPEEDWKEYKNDDITFFKRESDTAKSDIAYWESMQDSLDSDSQLYYEAMMDRIQENEKSNTIPSFTLGLSVLVFSVVGIFLRRKN